MDDKTREELTENVIDCIHSLDHSLQQCGGGDMESIEVLKSRTMFDFICHVAAPNGIRFHYEDKHIEKQEKEEKKKNPKSTKTIRCPNCGCEDFSDPLGEKYRICTDCEQEWFSDIDYSEKCDNCGENQVGFDGFCRDCNWEQIKTKEDLNKIQVHNQP